MNRAGLPPTLTLPHKGGGNQKAKLYNLKKYGSQHERGLVPQGESRLTTNVVRLRLIRTTQSFILIGQVQIIQ